MTAPGQPDPIQIAQFWQRFLAAHTRAFKRLLPALGVDFHDKVPTVFQRFEVLYQEPA